SLAVEVRPRCKAVLFGSDAPDEIRIAAFEGPANRGFLDRALGTAWKWGGHLVLHLEHRRTPRIYKLPNQLAVKTR
ncbi:MAG: hypothetical protein OEM59_18610, partial [Rhodospirillales bacterium]|nr:hypothetical protein [Rhodospirillales bacterium]